MPNLRKQVESIVKVALAKVVGDGEAARTLVTPATGARFGDYQCNAAMPLAKTLGKKPRDIATDLVEAIGEQAMFEDVSIAGPGFINFRLSAKTVGEAMGEVMADDRLGVPPVKKPERIVLDFSSPNVAKPMHVGHLRGTCIGDCIQRMLRFVGHEVISDNHIGDWGTQFGIILHQLELIDNRIGSIEEVAKLYADGSALKDADGEFADKCRAAIAELQNGDLGRTRIWGHLVAASKQEFMDLYDRLGVNFDEWLGESFFNRMLSDVVADLEAKHLAEESDGAMVVFSREQPDRPPCIIRKTDGAFLYATTDLAAIKHRVDQWRADRIIYTTDGGQQLHFKQVFEVARLWGYDKVSLEHVWFGVVLGDGGKRLRTKSGKPPALTDLLDESISRARKVVDQVSGHLGEDQRQNIAEVVGIAALKYFELGNNRTSDYVFDWNKVMSLDGNSAPYMLYAYARNQSIFAKGEVDASELAALSGPFELTDPHELALAKAVLRLPEAIDSALAELRPNMLTAYLYDLAIAYSRFFTNCPVLKSDEPVRTNRLRLCDATARTLKLGLHLLGIETLDRM